MTEKLDKIVEDSKLETGEINPVDQESAQTGQKEFTEEEREAWSLGWRPDKGPKTAGEYLRSGPLFREISTSHEKISKLESAIAEMTKHMTKQQELGYKKALDELQQARKEAIELGDISSVDQIEEEMKKYNNSVTSSTSEFPKAYNDFLERNKFWIDDEADLEAEEMRQFALNRENYLKSRGKTPEQIADIVEQNLKTKYPHKFSTEMGYTAGTQVESNISTAKTANISSAVSLHQLNDAQKLVYKYVYDHEGEKEAKEYLKQLKEMGGIKDE